MIEIAAHLRELNYFTRPDYAKIYQILEVSMLTFIDFNLFVVRFRD